MDDLIVGGMLALTLAITVWAFVIGSRRRKSKPGEDAPGGEDSKSRSS